VSEASIPWISVQTCEDRARGEPCFPLEPERGESPLLFDLHDPFGVRKAIVPLFWMKPDGDLKGLGTALSTDPWGGFLTADHVIADKRALGRAVPDGPEGRDRKVDFPADEGFVALLGFGVAFGSCRLPQEVIAPVVRAWSPALEGDDPLAALQGRDDHRPIDLAVLTIRRPAAGLVHCLPLSGRPRGPRPGDMVVAIGFPTIDTFSGDQEAARTTIEEGMQVAYGRVRDIFPHGRDRSNPTPVFEVEANWPSGLSGAPVLDARGEVVGIVSRSYLSDDRDGIGTGWATWLEGLLDFHRWVPALDPDNADRRLGWAALRQLPWNLAAAEPTHAEADAAASAAGPGHEVLRGAWRLGTDDFMS
jgi:serine protease Do